MNTGMHTPRGNRTNLRGLFLLTIQFEAPHVIEKLLNLSPEHQWARIEPVPRVDVERIETWADRWRIRADWVLEHAAQFLADVERHPSVDPMLLWSCWSGDSGELIPNIKFRAVWNPTLPELPYNYYGPVGGKRAAARDELHRKLDAYLDAVEAAHKDIGFESNPRRLGKSNSSLEDRICWLVWRLCRDDDRPRWAGRPAGWHLVNRWANERAQGLTNDRFTLDLSNIKATVYKLATEIGIPLPGDPLFTSGD